MAASAPADLFAGTAFYYARYRLPYPAAMLALLAAAFGLDGKRRVLDLGTGTGQLAIPLAACCREVVAVDSSGEMLAEGQREAARMGVTNIRWLHLAAEALTPALGQFRAVTIAQAFHWMDRDEVLRRLVPLLETGGGVALLGMTTIWGAPEPWAQATQGVVQRWLGEERRAGDGLHARTRAHDHRRFEDVLADGGFGRVQGCDWTYQHEWRVESIVGYLYSTSYCNPRLLGDRVVAFEADLRQTLLAIEPSGCFRQAITVSCLLAQRE